MKILLDLLQLALIIVGCGALLFVFLDTTDNIESHFQNYRELAASGLIGRGWLPPHLPRSATDIHGSYNVDTNRVYASFRFQPGDLKVISVGCRLVAETEEGHKFLCPPYDRRTVTVTLRKDGTGSLRAVRDGL